MLALMGGYNRRLDYASVESAGPEHHCIAITFYLAPWVCLAHFSTDRTTSRNLAKDTMAEISRNRRNTLERKCLPKALKRLFKGSTRTTFKMLEKVKPTKNVRN